MRSRTMMLCVAAGVATACADSDDTTRMSAYLELGFQANNPYDGELASGGGSFLANTLTWPGTPEERCAGGALGWGPPSGGEPETPEFLHAGDTIRFESGETSLIADWTGDNYSGTLLGEVPVDAAYDVVVPGGDDLAARTFADAVRVPAIPQIADFAVQNAASYEITWSPAGTATWVALVFAEENSIICWALDDGSFELSPEVVAALPVGTNGLATVLVNQQAIPFRGEHMMTRGSSRRYSTYVRPAQ